MSQKLNTTTRQMIKDLQDDLQQMLEMDSLQNNKAFQKSADLIRKSLEKDKQTQRDILGKNQPKQNLLLKELKEIYLLSLWLQLKYYVTLKDLMMKQQKKLKNYLYLTKEEMKTLKIYKTRKDELVEKWNTLTIIQKVYKLSKIKDNNMLLNKYIETLTDDDIKLIMKNVL